MNYKISFVLVFSSIILVCSSGYSAFEGKYEAYNTQLNKDLVPAASTETRNGNLKNFFGAFSGQNNRAPVHDTPASFCNCSK